MGHWSESIKNKYFKGLKENFDGGIPALRDMIAPNQAKN
jgi:hypothetical protein